MLAAAFVSQGLDSLRRPMSAADAARPTLVGLRKRPEPVGSRVPENPETFAKLTAATQIGGGLLLATGRLPRLASAALAATVLPANLGSHMFWSEPDSVTKARKRREFMVDLSLLGGLIIASADTAGKPSLGWRGRHAAHRLSEAVTAGLAIQSTDGVMDKIGHGLHTGAERGQELVSAAAERGAPLLDAARKHGEAALEVTRDRGGRLANEAKTAARSEARRLAKR